MWVGGGGGSDPSSTFIRRTLGVSRPLFLSSGLQLRAELEGKPRYAGLEEGRLLRAHVAWRGTPMMSIERACTETPPCPTAVEGHKRVGVKLVRNFTQDERL